MRDTKGITLITLIITIIILLILAGITISKLIESGLLEKAKLAKEEFKNTENIQNETLDEYKTEIEKNIYESTRDNNTDQNFKVTVLFDSTTHPDGPIVNAGTNDGTSERRFSDEIKNYDILLIYYGTRDSEHKWQPNIVYKMDFDCTLLNVVHSFSSIATREYAFIKIDTQTNKIIFEKKGYDTIEILRVVGFKL